MTFHTKFLLFPSICVPPNNPITACGATSFPGYHSFPKWAIDAAIMVSKNCPITGKHVGIISARWNFLLLWNFDKQNEMQLLAKLKQILYVGFRASLNFRKFKVALNSMYRIALNVSLNLSIYYSFRHVLKPGTPEHRNTGTPEHHNTPEYPG